MKIISWNLNGLLSCMKNDALFPIEEMEPDIVCCQEIRTKQQMEVMYGYQHFWNPSRRDGFHGTLTMTKESPSRVSYGLGDEALDAEGRVITVEIPSAFIVNAYAPMSQKDLERHAFRLSWDEAFREYVCGLEETKPVIMCGDFNAARLDIDIFPENQRQFWARQGYASDEVSNLETLLEAGFVDAFRVLYPDKPDSYTWWANRKNRRVVDRGWRLDYFFVSERLLSRIVDVKHYTELPGSDHCPIELEIRI